MMTLYHRTRSAAAASIQRNGFRDSTDTYMTHHEYTGVWLSDHVLDANEGACGDVVLAIEIPEEQVTPYEWIETEKGYREFLVPAEILNTYGPPRLDESLDAIDARFLSTKKSGA
jgi:hypothetical protein